ncbi:MAG: ELM1/GtrOC1 family putative glycosyltransferase [Candidatus Omnitrophota bacterium]
MKKSFYRDYFLFSLARVISFLLFLIPIRISLFFARAMGCLVFHLDSWHRKTAYLNLKFALGDTKSRKQLFSIVKKSYQNLAQSILEALYLPRIDKPYLDKFVEFEQKSIVEEILKQNKGLIFLGIHLGSWELSNCIGSLLFPPHKYNVIVKEQNRYGKLDLLLNSYRESKGVNIISKGIDTRELIQGVKNHEILAMVGDQGGRDGTLAHLFGRLTSFPTGAIRLALKYDIPVIPAFTIRKSGPFHRVVIYPRLNLKNTGNIENDVLDNLENFNRIAEDIIRKYPAQYLWIYKIWKYSPERNIIILSDDKTGHIRQSQSVAKILRETLEESGLIPKINISQVIFKNKFYKLLLNVLGACGLKLALTPASYKELSIASADFIISCGTATSLVNKVLAKDSRAKSIHIMRPAVFTGGEFDLIISPRHDKAQVRKNTVVTEIAPNLVDDKYLDAEVRSLVTSREGLDSASIKVGLLLGGETKDYVVSVDDLSVLIRELKNCVQDLSLELLVTTSRRTSVATEGLIKGQLQDYPRCKLLIIANEDNIPQAVGGILALSSIVIVSGESISMISEAVSSGKHVLVFPAKIKSPTFDITRHQRFLNNLAQGGYIKMIQPKDLAGEIKRILETLPPIKMIRDNEIIREAIRKII